jgi:hypothetical protein
MRNLTKLILLSLLILVGITGCTKKDPQVTFNGRIVNTTGRPVASASIKVDNAAVGSSDATGNFSVNIAEGSHIFTVDAPGYNSTPITVNTASLTTGTMDLTILGSANISGTIIDSQTGRGLSGAVVSFSVDGIIANVANAPLVVTTGTNGTFSIQNGPTGSFYCIIVFNGYFTRVADRTTFIIGINNLTQQTLVSRPTQGSMRIILTWGASPSDLDSHLTGPSSTGSKFHVYWNNKAPDAGVNLDVDDVTSYGPETTTISILRNGVYRYSVYNFSTQSTSGGQGIASSPAVVEVYSYDGLLKTYTAPAFTGSGNTWRVFEMTVSGTSANIVSKNVYVQASSSTDVATFKGASDAAIIKGLTKDPVYDILDF